MARSKRRTRPSAQFTTDHEIIRRWVESRGGRPAHLLGTGEGEDPGLLRIIFPGYSEARLEEVPWDLFFRKFEEKELAFFFQEMTKEGTPSRYFKLTSRNTPVTESH